MQHLSEIAEEITLNWNSARILSLVLLILQKKKKTRKKNCYKDFLQDCNLHFIFSDLEGRICNNTAFSLHTKGRGSLLDHGKDYPLQVTTSNFN